MSEVDIYRKMGKEGIPKFLLNAKICNKDNCQYIKELQQENEVLENEKDMFYKVSQERLNKWLSLNDENNKLVEIIKDYKSRCEKTNEIAKDLKQFVYDELVDRNVCGATETHDKIINLLNTLNGKE